MPNSSNKYHLVISRTRRCNAADGNEEKVKLRFDGRPPQQERFFIPVSKGDKVRFGKKDAWVWLPNMGDEVQILPAWRFQKDLLLNGKRIRLIIKEIEKQDELKAYRALTQFHYRGNGSAGRRVPLIAKINVWNLSEVVGFVELSSSMIVGVARKKILDTDFYDSERNFGWSKWDYDTAKKYTNAVLRISRCVVYPELRGIGLAAILAEAAVKFATERWHAGGLRPSFIEIIAEMLRYWPFVEKAGFVKIGETEGNVKRAPKAMEYLLKRKANKLGYPKGGGGIMSMHRMHAEKLSAIQQERKMSIDEVVKLLKRPSHKLNARDWVSLHDIHRPKKPVYMRGLTDSAKQHLAKRVKIPPKEKRESSRSGVLAEISELQITATVSPQKTARCRKIQEAFGIVSNKIQTELMHEFSAEFASGEVILVSGASGTGKSLFLRALHHVIQGKKSKMPTGVFVSAQSVSKKAKVMQIKKPPKNQSPIELLKHLSLDDAMKVLAQAGLAEADLFVRPSYALSVGQVYRLSLAIALSKNPDIILIDEFCEPLDEYTTAVICRKLRKMTLKNKCAAVVATADARNVMTELKPDRTLLLLAGGCHKWIHP